MAKKSRKVVKRTVTKTSGRKRNKWTLKRTFRNLNLKNTGQSPTWSPANSLKSKKAGDAVRSNYALRSSGTLKTLKISPRRPSKRIEARSQRNFKRALQLSKTPSRTLPKRRHRQKTVRVSSAKLKQRTKEISQTSPLALKLESSEVEIEVESEEYEVEKVCDIKFTDGQELYLVKWKGFAAKHNT